MGNTASQQSSAFVVKQSESDQPVSRVVVEHCSLSWWDMIVLIRSVSHCDTKVTEITIVDANVGYTLTYYMSWLLGQPMVRHSLTSLTFSSNDIRANGMKNVIKALALCQCLQTLRMDRNWISDEGVKCLAVAVSSLPSLRYLFIGYNFLTDASGEVLADLVGGPRSQMALTSLNLDGNMLGGLGMRSFSQRLTNQSHLTELSLVGNGLGCLGAHSLALTLSSHSRLQTLNLSGNDLGAKGAYVLARGLRRFGSPKLEALDLSYNNVILHQGDMVTEEWKGFLNSPGCVLRSLNFSYNKLGDEMCVVLLKAPSLTELIIAHVGVTLDPKTFSESPATDLRTLDLSFNDISNNCFDGLRELLRRRKSLTSLLLRGNLFEDASAEELRDVLCISRSLHAVEIRDCFMTNETKEKVFLRNCLRFRIIVD